jgi:hypothetical protein
LRERFSSPTKILCLIKISNSVADGLEALKTLDSNNDGQFTSADAKWNDLRVWVDANEDVITDAGELKTLGELNIASINLDRTITYRERIAGNPVLSRSTYTTTSGQIRDAAAVDFTTNPIGYEWNDAFEDGAKITAQDGSSSSFVITDANGATIDLGALHVNSGYGNIGDANDNWLMGGAGNLKNFIKDFCRDLAQFFTLKNKLDSLIVC